MAIMRCPECGKEISDSAPQCPGCGYARQPPPLRPPGPVVVTVPPMTDHLKTHWAIGCAIGAAVAMGMVAVLGILAAIAIPAFAGARTKAQAAVCLARMSELEMAKESLAKTNHWENGHVIGENPEAIWSQLAPFVVGTNMPYCRMAPGRHYIYGPVGTRVKCPVAGQYPRHSLTLSVESRSRRQASKTGAPSHVQPDNVE